jgi:hypothetical protein
LLCAQALHRAAFAPDSSANNPGIKIEKGVKLSNLGIRLNIACAGQGAAFITKFRNYSYWMDGDKPVDGSKVMVLEIWVNNRRIIRCFQNANSRLLFCEVVSWPNGNRQQIIMADFCSEGDTLPNGTMLEVYEFVLRLFEAQAANLKRPGRILNVIKKIRGYESLLFAGSLDQF